MVNSKRKSAVTPDQVVAARKAANMTQRAVAEALEVSRATMQNYERGTTAMPKTAYAALLELNDPRGK